MRLRPFRLRQQHSGHAGTVGGDIENAVDDAGNAVGGAMDDVGDAAKNAGKAVSDAVKP